MSRVWVIGIILACLFSTTYHAQTQDDDGFIRADRLGIAHISSYTEDTPDTRYQQALQLGAGWNRFPIYWNVAQPEPETWDWSAFDRQILNDLSYGLQINAILLGRPQFYAAGDNGERIAGINEPIFSDGTDTPANGKTLNPDNPWVTFVFEAVNRYKPEGLLAQQGFIPSGQGVRVWEIWNEPDHLPFWGATIRDYARLLKISYIVAKLADPDAQVMFGGLLFTQDGVNWLAQVLSLYVNDPFAEQNNYYMDIIAVHSYADPWRSGWLVLNVRQTLIAYGIDRPVWLNETGVPVWDDYPGPIWAPQSTDRATLDQQAYFLIQSAAFAWLEGADVIIYHQLYDDCGDQPAGTDFPPHQGELCDTIAGNCFGDAHGMYRNQATSVCFSQHPLPGTPRPVARAYRLLAEVFGREAFDRGERLFNDDRATIITFERPLTNERVSIIWNRTFDFFTLDYPAVGERGQLISLRDDTIIRPNASGNYQIDLSAAAPDNYDTPEAGADSAIGGAPVILIESIDGDLTPDLIDLDGFDSPQATFEAVEIVPTPRPTVDPAQDTQPPSASVNPLQASSPATFTVSWGGVDNSGIYRFMIFVREPGAQWQMWQETAETSAEFTGTAGNTYEFAAWAVDLAGNWSENINLQAQATTTVE